MSKKPKPDSWYRQVMDKHVSKKRLARNFAVAFLAGGFFAALAECGDFLLQKRAGLAEQQSGAIVLIVVVGLTALLTGAGIYDKLGQKLGAGLAVPISGFANSVASSMLEHRSEGLVLGSGCNSFKLAGAVIVYGIAGAFVVALAKLLLGSL